MNSHFIRKEDYKTTIWSGGKTTQFFIFPTSSKFSVGKFDLRVSSATIEVDQSMFSHFIGYSRVITTLDYPIDIQHNDKDVKTLQPFELHSFLGSDTTVSYGKCTDFNVIFKEGMDVKVSVLKNNEVILEKDRQYVIYFINDCVIIENNVSNIVEKENCLHLSRVMTVVIIQTYQKNNHVSAIIISF